MASRLIYQKIDIAPKVRQRLIRRLDAQKGPPPNPLDAYTILFGEQVPQPLVRRIRQLYSMHGRRPGYIYCFRDVRDAPNVYKIGRTVTSVSQRMAEWRRELNAAPHELNAIWSTYCHNVVVAETLIFNALYSRRLRDRYHAGSDRFLTEYVKTSRLESLRYFLIAVTWHVSTCWEPRR